MSPSYAYNFITSYRRYFEIKFRESRSIKRCTTRRMNNAPAEQMYVCRLVMELVDKDDFLYLTWENRFSFPSPFCLFFYEN